MSARHPSISVVIPAYNAERFLADAVASVRAQTVPVDEIIVVEDGSSDSTAQTAEALGVRCLRQPNAGPSAARNQGVAAASGELVAFLDADDQWTPEKTAEQLEALRKTPGLALVASDMAEVDEQGEVRVFSWQERHGQRQLFESLAGAPIHAALRRLLEANFIPTGSVLVRRAALDEAGPFAEGIRYGEDLELWARIAARQPIACLPRVHLLRRRHDANATDNSQALLEDLVRVAESVRGWGREALSRQGLDADTQVARALNDLGYWHFDRGELSAARQAFAQSLRERTTARAVFYGAAAHLPATLVRRLRTVKQRINRSKI